MCRRGHKLCIPVCVTVSLTSSGCLFSCRSLLQVINKTLNMDVSWSHLELFHSSRSGLNLLPSYLHHIHQVHQSVCVNTDDTQVKPLNWLLEASAVMKSWITWAADVRDVKMNGFIQECKRHIRVKHLQVFPHLDALLKPRAPNASRPRRQTGDDQKSSHMKLKCDKITFTVRQLLPSSGRAQILQHAMY